MDRAIENYSIGKQHEVSAEDIEKLNLGSINADTKRFICDICGEPVRFQCRVKSRHDGRKSKKEYFAHLPDKEDIKFCEKRTDSAGNYTIYERVGLPLYIKKTTNNNFKLCIGFYSIDEKTLSYAQSESMFVLVQSKWGDTQQTARFLINNSNFLTNAITYKPLDFLAERYSLKYSSNAERLLGRKWSDFAEGVLSGGALFTFDESGGRKIRINEEITTGIDYFLLIRNRSYAPALNGLDCQVYGEVEFKSGQCKLYKVRFTTINSKLSDFCRENLKVSLLYRQAKLIPIWPPCSKKDNRLSLFDNICVGHFAVVSDNEAPQVFSHIDNLVSPIGVSKKNDSIFTVKLLIGNSVMPITVDRKFSGNILFIDNKLAEVKEYKNSAKVFALDESEYQACEYAKIPPLKSLKITSDSTSIVIHKKSVNIQTPFPIKNASGIVVQDISFDDEIVVLSGAEQLKVVSFKRQLSYPKDRLIDDGILAFRLSKMGKPYVATLHWIKESMKLFKDRPKSFAILKGYLNYNIMPQEAIMVLKEELQKMKVGI